MTNVKLQIAHQVPGRVRMKIPSAKGNVELLKQIADAFGQIPGIEEIKVNPTTGSVVLQYDAERHDEFQGGFHHHYRNATGEEHRPPTNEIDAFAQKIEDEAEFLAQNSASARALVDFFKGMDRNIKMATSNNLDLKMLLAVGIIGVTVLEVGATAATPVWVTLSLFALNHYIDMHSAHLPAGTLAAPVTVKGSTASL